MEEADKSMLLGELNVAKMQFSAVSSQISGLNMNSFPVVGNMVMIPALSMAGNAMRMQSECIEKLIKVIEKVIEKA